MLLLGVTWLVRVDLRLLHELNLLRRDLVEVLILTLNRELRLIGVLLLNQRLSSELLLNQRLRSKLLLNHRLGSELLALWE